MNNNFGRKRNNTGAYVASAVMAVVCLTVCVVLFAKLGQKNKIDSKAQSVSGTSEDVQSSVVVDGDKEMRGVWIASTININFPSKTGLSVQELKAEIDDIVNNTAKVGLNAIFFQVRPCEDALYNSDIFPTSKYLTGTQGQSLSENFDCLSYMIESAKKSGIEVHAWVNPYRVTMYEKDEAELSDKSIAKTHPEYTIKYADGKTYLDPGLPEVRDFVVSGIKEIVTNYPDLAGVHYDDYFYPYPKDGIEFDDNTTYEKYGKSEDKGSWRRENVNKLVKETYEAVKSINHDCRFGVSTFGIWANSTSDTPVVGSDTKGLECYNDLYCDPLSWAKGKYVDYIAPQDYWSFDTNGSPFDTVARWWNANLDSSGVDLYVGHAAYKAKDYVTGEIASQVEFSRTLLTYKGSIFYGYEDIKNDTNGVATRLKALYRDETYYSQPETNGEKVSFSFPDNNSNVATPATYILGSSDPAYPVEIDGERVSRTKDGYFGAYTGLEAGKNEIGFVQNGKTTVLSLNYGTTKQSGSGYKTLDSMKIGTTLPSGDTWVNVGDTLKLSCVAPAGSTVTATIGGMTVVLSPTINPPADSKYMYEYYTGSVTPSEFAAQTEICTLGTLVFKAEKDGEAVEKISGVISQPGKQSYAVAEVINDYSYTKIATDSSFYDDFLPSSSGVRDYITQHTEGFYKLRFGGFVAEENLKITYGKQLLVNKLLTTGMEVVCTDSSNNKNNTTDLRFGVTENIPVDVDFTDGFMRIIMYNTDTSVIPDFTVTANPLVSSVTGSVGTKPNMVIYKVKLKNDDNFYGFNIVYENGMMIVKLNNPQSLAAGDKPLSGKTIYVDAGHGGTDIGAPGPGTSPEKVLNFNIASKLAQKLRALGATVVETRTTDTTVSLVERMDNLNKTSPDMAISVHHNSVASSSNAQKARGFLSLYSNNSGVLLAKTVSQTVCTELNRQERKTSYQQLAVARNHRFPSTLVEMCFISNVEEYQWSVSAGNADRSAASLVDGILNYYKAQEAYLEY